MRRLALLLLLALPVGAGDRAERWSELLQQLEHEDAECETIGDSNLMWPFDLGFAIGLQLSRGQADAIKKHPLVDPGTVPAPPAKLAQLGGGGVLPVGVLRSWCANCAGRYGR